VATHKAWRATKEKVGNRCAAMVRRKERAQEIFGRRHCHVSLAESAFGRVGVGRYYPRFGGSDSIYQRGRIVGITGESLRGVDSLGVAQGGTRMDRRAVSVVGACACNKDAARAKTSDSLVGLSRSQTIACSIARASKRCGSVYPSNRVAFIKLLAAKVGANRPEAQGDVGVWRSGKGQEGDWCAAQLCGGGSVDAAQGEQYAACVCIRVSGHATESVQQPFMEQDAQAITYQEFQVARSAPYVGKLACAVGHIVARFAEAWWMGNSSHGAGVCASSIRAYGTGCRANCSEGFGEVMTRIGHVHKNKRSHASRNSLKEMVRPPGLEPGAHGLKARGHATTRTIVIGHSSVKQFVSEFKNTVVISILFERVSRIGHAAFGGFHAYI